MLPALQRQFDKGAMPSTTDLCLHKSVREATPMPAFTGLLECWMAVPTLVTLRVVLFVCKRRYWPCRSASAALALRRAAHERLAHPRRACLGPGNGLSSVAAKAMPLHAWKSASVMYKTRAHVRANHLRNAPPPCKKHGSWRGVSLQP